AVLAAGRGRDLVFCRRGGAVGRELPQSLEDTNLLVELIHPALEGRAVRGGPLLLRHGLWHHCNTSRCQDDSADPNPDRSHSTASLNYDVADFRRSGQSRARRRMSACRAVVTAYRLGSV